MSRRFLLLWWRTSPQSYLTDPSLWVIVLCKSHRENSALPSTRFPMELSSLLYWHLGGAQQFWETAFLDLLQLCWQRNPQTMEMIEVKRQMCFRMSFLRRVYRTPRWTLLIWDEITCFGKWPALDLGEDCLLLMWFGHRKLLYTDVHNAIFVICRVEIIHCLHLFLSHFHKWRLLSRWLWHLKHSTFCCKLGTDFCEP